MAAGAWRSVDGAGSLNNGPRSEFVSAEAPHTGVSYVTSVLVWEGSDQAVVWVAARGIKRWDVRQIAFYSSGCLLYIQKNTPRTRHTQPRFKKVIVEITQAGVGLASHHRMQRLAWCQSITYHLGNRFQPFVKKQSRTEQCLQHSSCSVGNLPVL